MSSRSAPETRPYLNLSSFISKSLYQVPGARDLCGGHLQVRGWLGRSTLHLRSLSFCLLSARKVSNFTWMKRKALCTVHCAERQRQFLTGFNELYLPLKLTYWLFVKAAMLLWLKSHWQNPVLTNRLSGIASYRLPPQWTVEGQVWDCYIEYLRKLRVK